MHMLAQPWGIAYAVSNMIVYADVFFVPPIVTLIGQILQLIAYIMMVVLIMNLRQAFRNKYGIVAGRDGCCSCEDCCCSFWCMPCTLSQMHRHTDITHQLQPAGCNCSSPV
jgi:Cys-rich protein (TIGR01571 family)